jgi:hypothetical protein
MNSVYILFLIISSSNGGVITERFRTPSLGKCEMLLLDINKVSTHANVNGLCIRC